MAPFPESLLRKIARVAFLAAVVCVGPRGADAAGEKERRLAAELLVMAGDLERLTSPDTSPLHRRGLTARLAGAMAPLILLIRSAREENPSLAEAPRREIASLRAVFVKGDTDTMKPILRRLLSLYPFRPVGILPPGGDQAAFSTAQGIHENYCTACHEDGDSDVERPAVDLFDMAHKVDVTELAARLVIGVRGDALTTLDNPLCDREISALIGFYRNGMKE